MLCNHEEIAVADRARLCKATGKPMAVILHNLVGLLHACMAIYFAYLDACRSSSSAPPGRWTKPSAVRTSTGPTRRSFKATRCATTSNGIPADLDRRRAGELRARLFGVDDRAEGARSTCAMTRRCRRRRRPTTCRCRRSMPSPRRRRWRPTRAPIEAIADKLLKAEHPMLLRNMPAGAPARFESIRCAGELTGVGGVGRQQRAQFPEQQASALSQHGHRRSLTTTDLILGLDVKDWEKSSPS